MASQHKMGMASAEMFPQLAALPAARAVTHRKACALEEISFQPFRAFAQSLQLKAMIFMV
jgi:hypothetical protein